MKKVFLIAAAAAMASVSANAQAQVTTVIMGEVVDRPQSDELMLLRAGEDFRIKYVSIPIVNGKFEHILSAPHEEMYNLIFEEEARNGSWRTVSFFAENDTVRMTLHSDGRYEENAIDGGPLNRQYRSFIEQLKRQFDPTPLYDEMDALDRSGRLHNERAEELLSVLRNDEADRAERDSIGKVRYELKDSGGHYSPEGAAVHRKIMEFNRQAREWEIDYARNNVSIPSYFVLTDKLQPGYSHMGFDNTSAYELYNTVYAGAYPDHPYTRQLRTSILADALRAGGKYIDFTAPDFAGDPVTLSEQIGGKVALIDLWASWCGPCRRAAMSMIPVYEKFRERGFTIVGVARERDAEDGIAAARRDGYPWLNLLEVRDAAGIWELYGVGNAGGATFLVDRDGTVIAINPDAAKVEKILGEIL